MPTAFLSPEELAEELDCGASTIRKLCQQAQLGIMYKGRYYIHPDEARDIKATERPPGKRKRGVKSDPRENRAIEELVRAVKKPAEIRRLTGLPHCRIYDIYKEITRIDRVERARQIINRVVTGSESAPAAETSGNSCQ